MPGLFFTNAWMLAGLAALAIPVIIHLLLRRKKKRLRFSTLQFFIKQDEQASQRRKLRNWLLLALRLLICALIVLAFARPYLQGDGAAAAGQGRRQVVVLLDRTLSVQAVSAAGSKWSQAKEAARKLLAELGHGDRAALVATGARAEVLSEWAPAVAVGKALEGLQPSCGSAGLAEGFKHVNTLLAFRDPKAALAVYVVSDFQRNSCEGLASVPLPRDVEVKTVPIGDIVTPNIAVTELRIDANDGAGPRAVITSFSDEDSPALKMELAVDGTVVSSTTLSLNAGASTNVDITIPPLKPGWHDVALQLPGRDSLTLDNARFETVLVPEPARVVVVETRQSNRVFEEESFFVSAALDPSSDGTNSIPGTFAVEKVSFDGLPGKLAVGKGGLSCDMILLPGLRQVSSTLGTALISYVREGGGLLMFVGDGVTARQYSEALGEVMPAALGDMEHMTDLSSVWRIGSYDTNSSIFGVFQLPNSGNLSLGRFLKRFTVPRADPGLVLARFEDQTPFLLVKKIGKGRVVLVNTSADTSWNDWPKHKTFVPWVHGTGRYLAGLAELKVTQRPGPLLAGAEDDLDLGAAAASKTFKFLPGAGKELAFTADAQGMIADVTLPAPGVYSLRDSAGKEVRRLAVNVSAVESDLTALGRNSFQGQLARVSEPPKTTFEAGLFGSGSNQRELWRVLLLSVLGLLVLEMLLANRTLA